MLFVPYFLPSSFSADDALQCNNTTIKRSITGYVWTTEPQACTSAARCRDQGTVKYVYHAWTFHSIDGHRGCINFEKLQISPNPGRLKLTFSSLWFHLSGRVDNQLTTGPVAGFTAARSRSKDAHAGQLRTRGAGLWRGAGCGVGAAPSRWISAPVGADSRRCFYPCFQGALRRWRGGHSPGVTEALRW